MRAQARVCSALRPIREQAPSWRFVAAGVLLSVVLAAAYLPLRHNGFVNFDDDRLILDNPALRDLSPGGLGSILDLQLFTPHYKPLVNLSWAAELRLFGPDPAAFHRHNLLLHLLNALLIMGLVCGLAPAGASRNGRLAAAAAVAAIWALHPMKVESVAWAAERKDLLYAAFYLGAMLSYLRFVDRHRRRWLALSAALALGAALSKSTAITLLPALLLIDLARRRRPAAALGGEKLPHLAVSLLALYLYGLLPGPGGAGGSLALLAGAEPIARLGAAAHRHLAFAGRWLAPTDLAVLYSVPDFLARPGWYRLAAYAAAHLALLAGLAWTVRRSRRIAAAALFYSLTLLPVLVAPVSITNYLSDRYTYLPSLGLASLAVLAAAELQRRRPATGKVLAAAAVLAVAGLGLLTFRQVAVWHDSRRLWDHVLRVQPAHPYAHNNRGVAALDRGDLESALADFDHALAARPAYPEALANRGDLLRRLGRPAEALSDLDRAVALQPGNGAIYRTRGLARLALGRIGEAIADYDRAVALDPADAEALYQRSQARSQTGDLEGARADVDRVLAVRPQSTGDAFLLRALLRARLGDLDGALADTTHALELDPANAVASNNRGYLRLRLDDPSGALADLERALALRPDYPLAQRNRGDALAALGRQVEACGAWRLAATGGAPAAGSRLANCPTTAPTFAPGPG